VSAAWATNTITISGTPTATGTFNYSIPLTGGCGTVNATGTITVNVDCPVIPSTITIGSNAEYTVISMYDTDYLPYSLPVAPATTATCNADGTAEPKILNIQGTITTAEITVRIPVTVTAASSALPAFTTTAVVPANMTSDGISRTVELSWTADIIGTAKKVINATLKSLGGDLNLKQLDLNCGLGNDYKGVLAITIPYYTNQDCDLSNLSLRISPAIPDLKFGQTVNGDFNHNFLYLPVVRNNGKIWLNNNLGADYSNIDHTSFNVSQQATSSGDKRAYGSLYEWGRETDGHELIDRSSLAPTASVLVNLPTISTNNNDNTPGHKYFITGSDGFWMDNQNTAGNNMWQNGTTPNQINNPCPKGFRVPTTGEWTTEYSNWSSSNATGAANSPLKLTTAGRVLGGAIIEEAGDPIYGGAGRYWTSTWALYFFDRLAFFPSNVFINANGTYPEGSSIRCIQD